jgi:hypothetical protein
VTLPKVDKVNARLIGAGHYVPENRVTASDVAKLVPGWDSETIIERTGIKERRWLWKIDDKTQKIIVPEVEQDSVCHRSWKSDKIQTNAPVRSAA